MAISQTRRPTDDTIRCLAAHRGVDERTDDPESGVLQETELKEEFEERPLRGANFDLKSAAATPRTLASPYNPNGLRGRATA